MALGTNDVDYRSRPSSDEELSFLTGVVGQTPQTGGVTYADLEQRGLLLLADRAELPRAARVEHAAGRRAQLRGRGVA